MIAMIFSNYEEIGCDRGANFDVFDARENVGFTHLNLFDASENMVMDWISGWIVGGSRFTSTFCGEGAVPLEIFAVFELSKKSGEGAVLGAGFHSTEYRCHICGVWS
jgi:hypothetical protein